MSMVSSGLSLLSLLVIAFVLSYVCIYLILIRKKPSVSWIPALIITVLATVLYWNAYGKAGVADWLSRSILSLFGAIKLFVFSELSSSGKLTPIFYGETGMTPEQLLTARNNLLLLHGLFLCAICTTSILIVHFFARRLSSKIWLLTHRPSDKQTHIFVGADRNSLSLAADLAKTKGNQIIFVVFPKREGIPAKVSVSQLFHGLKSDTDQTRDIVAVVPSAVVLLAKSALINFQGKDLFKDAGLSRLSRWAENKGTRIYCLSEASEDVSAIIKALSSSSAELFIYSDMYGLNDRLELSSDLKLHFLDDAQITEKLLKRTPALHPVFFIERAMDGSGEPLGWVKTAFNALLLGFEGANRGVLSFLYEYAAFVGEDKHPVPFVCDVMDPEATRLGGDFRVHHPGINEDKVRFNEMEIGTETFWSFVETILPTLNYMSIDLGSDEQNAHMALDMLELLCRLNLPQRPAVLVKIETPEKMKDLFAFHTNSLGMDSLFFIGEHDKIWTAANILNDELEPFGRILYQSYCQATASNDTWESRKETIWQKNTSELWKRREYHRKVELDYGNYLHRKEKEALMPRRFINDPEIADSIPSMYEGVHFNGANRQDETRLEYLSIGEHIHWIAAHEIHGYKRGANKREDIKEHTDLTDYFDLSETVRHYDWVMIKTTLILLREEMERR